MSERQAAGAPPALDSTAQTKEAAVHQHRHWVRTTYACNNHCTFCLDGDAPNFGHRREAEVRADIEAGFQPGARLILSGGEASIHPQFIDFVAHGKKTGYAWIQTITNGRMFAYQPFALQAAAAGLSEVTFSMHGHTSELHDTLTGIPGGFAQALRGMTNLLKDGRIVVNVDVVINGLNYKALDDILDFYMRLGIHEFDLLQIVPFGRAWRPENRAWLFYDVDEAFPYLNRAFKRAAAPGNYIWTNRFPVAYLEGIEHLIQDPHKLFDEMRGRREEFERFTERGEKLQCAGERCAFCFLQDYCQTLYALGEQLASDAYACLEIDLREQPAVGPETLQAILAKNHLTSWRLRAQNVAAALLWLDSGRLPGAGALELDDWTVFLKIWETTPDRLRAHGLRRLVASAPESIETLSRLPFELEITVTKTTEPELMRLKSALAGRSDVVLAYPSVETLTEATATLVEPAAFFADWRETAVRSRGVPECIHPLVEADPPTLRLSALAADGRIDMSGYTRDYIRFDYHAASRRCQECKNRDDCRGLHLNTLRVFGFKTLQPISR
ncbi:MAG: radical SAM protein [Myxococcales bacterium]|nr:MAG: radical SAM protein [Myxococcales bacterium]